MDTLDEFVARDIAHYKTEGERAAYRAGLGTATIVCDQMAKKKRAARMRDALKECADTIWHIRETIRVR